MPRLPRITSPRHQNRRNHTPNAASLPEKSRKGSLASHAGQPSHARQLVPGGRPSADSARVAFGYFQLSGSAQIGRFCRAGPPPSPAG